MSTPTATADAALTPPALVLETAAEHLTARVPVVSPADRAGDVRRALAGRRFDTVAGIAVCEGGRFAGLLTPEEAARRLGRLQRADRDEPGARLFYVERTDALVGTLVGETWVPPGRLTRGDPDELAEAIHAELFTEWDGARSRELERHVAREGGA